MTAMILSELLKRKKFPAATEKESAEKLKNLQLRMLRIQQGIWHNQRRAILVFEGFDAAGKGGSIRNVVERLDPRGIRVHPIGPPSAEEQGKHYLYRFWQRLPAPGTIAIFDRSWYGRVLVERVEKLAPKNRLKAAYSEINSFESLLVADGIDLVKIFLAIHPEEQLKRFEARLDDPYKQWKLTEDDLRAHKKWNKYVKAADDALRLTSTAKAPWHLIPSDSKPYSHLRMLEAVTKALENHGQWIEKRITKERSGMKRMRAELKSLY